MVKLKTSATTLLELMVVMAIWSGLLVLILGFYVTASQVNIRHEKVSDSYRKVHDILETMDGLFSRAWLHNIQTSGDQAMTVTFSRPAIEPLTPFGQQVFLPPEILVLEPAPHNTLNRAARFPLQSQLVLTSVVSENVPVNGTFTNIDPDLKTTRRVLFTLDPGCLVSLQVKPNVVPPGGIPGMQYFICLEINVIVPTAAGPPTTLAALNNVTYQNFERFIQLENCDTSALKPPTAYVP